METYRDNEKEIDNYVLEQFLDDIFDTRAKMERQEFLNLVKQKYSWLLDSDGIRKNMKQVVEDRKWD